MTYRPRSEFLDIMVARGFYNDCTDMQGLDEAMLAGVVPGYIGFDATAASLHVGSLIQIMMLRWLQKTGHRPIVLMGGGTSKVGDPSFRADERALLTGEQIAANIAGIKRVFTSYVTFGDGPTGALMLDNSEWLDGLNYLEFLRDIGTHFSVNRMLGFDSVKSRLDRDQSLSFLEFNYMILQAYDFLEIHRRHGCLLQMGGSDQWGNIVNGIDLTRRVAGRGGLRRHLAAPDHRRRQEDGQEPGRRRLAQRRHAQPLRVLAVLAQHRRRRRRPLPQALHRAAGRRMRPSRRARRVPRSTRPRSCSPTRSPPSPTALTPPPPPPRRPWRSFEHGGVGDDLPTVTLGAGRPPAFPSRSCS